ncbi:DsbA family oxidoreductase [Albirhodobacter sp. R86504]|uniref:DsbA family oxidoreductase n=1 Tax=Albirhodobacter sp. R86504 TaxID=3093848 RepID=UPI0036730EE0
MTNSTETTTSPLRIDIVSDVACPWCVVGYRQLAAALEASGQEHEIHWHPFELNPNMPPEGENMVEHIARKYGTTIEQSRENRARIKAAGAQVGFEFAFDDAIRMHNTFDLHQLLTWASTMDDGAAKQLALKEALFSAHFTRHAQIADRETLADIAASVGLDRAEALAVLDDQRFANAVREEEGFWQSQGINGVPAMIFDRKHLVTGAQGVENYTQILSQLAQLRAEQPQA